MSNNKGLKYQNKLEKNWKVITDNLNSIEEKYNNNILAEMNDKETSSLYNNERKLLRKNTKLLFGLCLKLGEIMDEDQRKLEEEVKQIELENFLNL